MQKQFSRQELITMVDNVSDPEGKGYTSAQLDHQLMIFCASCPNPIAAMNIVIETMEPLTAAEMVDLALACPYLDMTTVPESEVAKEHPLRYMRFSVSDAK